MRVASPDTAAGTRSLAVLAGDPKSANGGTRVSGVIVHEWLQRTGGSENVFDVLGRTFPDAARVCLWNDSDGRFTEVEETVLARTPLRHSKAVALPVHAAGLA